MNDKSCIIVAEAGTQMHVQVLEATREMNQYANVSEILLYSGDEAGDVVKTVEKIIPAPDLVFVPYKRPDINHESNLFNEVRSRIFDLCGSKSRNITIIDDDKESDLKNITLENLRIYDDDEAYAEEFSVDVFKEDLVLPNVIVITDNETFITRAKENIQRNAETDGKTVSTAGYTDDNNNEDGIQIKVYDNDQLVQYYLFTSTHEIRYSPIFKMIEQKSASGKIEDTIMYVDITAQIFEVGHIFDLMATIPSMVICSQNPTTDSPAFANMLYFHSRLIGRTDLEVMNRLTSDNIDTLTSYCHRFNVNSISVNFNVFHDMQLPGAEETFEVDLDGNPVERDEDGNVIQREVEPTSEANTENGEAEVVEAEVVE